MPVVKFCSKRDCTSCSCFCIASVLILCSRLVIVSSRTVSSCCSQFSGFCSIATIGVTGAATGLSTFARANRSRTIRLTSSSVYVRGATTSLPYSSILLTVGSLIVSAANGFSLSTGISFAGGSFSLVTNSASGFCS